MQSNDTCIHNLFDSNEEYMMQSPLTPFCAVYSKVCVPKMSFLGCDVYLKGLQICITYSVMGGRKRTDHG